MGEQYIIRRKIGKGYEPIKNEVIGDLPPLALAVLAYRLCRDPSDRQPSADEIWKAWQMKHGEEQAPGRRLVRRADAVLEERGYKHRLIRRAKGERERSTTLVAYNLPVLRCDDADCASCAERDEGAGSGTLHEQPEQADEGTAFGRLESGTPYKEARRLPVPRRNPQDVESLRISASRSLRKRRAPCHHSRQIRTSTKGGGFFTGADRYTGFLIAAALGVGTGLLREGDDYALMWLRRTFQGGRHKTPVMLARYLARVVRAAPEQLRKLCNLAGDNGGYVHDDDSGPLAEARDLARPYRLNGRERAAADLAAEWACDVAQDEEPDPDLNWNARTALEAAWLQWHQPEEP